MKTFSQIASGEFKGIAESILVTRSAKVLGLLLLCASMLNAPGQTAIYFSSTGTNIALGFDSFQVSATDNQSIILTPGVQKSAVLNTWTWTIANNPATTGSIDLWETISINGMTDAMHYTGSVQVTQNPYLATLRLQLASGPMHFDLGELGTLTLTPNTLSLQFSRNFSGPDHSSFGALFNLTPVPEPQMMALAFLGAALMTFHRTSRLKRLEQRVAKATCNR